MQQCCGNDNMWTGFRDHEEIIHQLISCRLLKVSTLRVGSCDVVGGVVWEEDFIPIISL